MRLVFATLAFTALAMPAFAAETRLSQNGLRVEFQGPQFEVFTNAGWARASLCCAAGDVARMRGAAGNDYLVVTRGVGTSPSNPKRRSAAFKLVDRSEITKRSVFTFLSGFKPGDRQSVASSIFACEQANYLRNGI